MDLYKLRDNIGFVPQKANLFTGTIADNTASALRMLPWKKSSTPQRSPRHTILLWKKPHQFDELITEGATNVSGGQKQRLSIARALIRKPLIYIYDDSFSALDFRTDAKLRKALRQR